MPKVLVVTRNYPPLLGGMERLNWHLVNELGRYCELRLIAPQGAARHAPDGIVVDEVPLSPLPRFVAVAAVRTWFAARAWRPDWILAGSGLTAPLAWLAARGCGARAASYVHGLDLCVQHPAYRLLWRRALHRMDRVIANSHATARLAEAVGIASARLSIVHPGTELPAHDAAAGARFRQANGIDPNSALLLAVGRLTERKGLRQFVVEVLPRIVHKRPNVVLAVVGEAPRHALSAHAQTPESIVSAAASAGVAANLRMLGKLDEARLHDAYFAADVHVFPTRELAGDLEGFGMVALEAAAHGLWSVAYAAGGVVDAVGQGASGDLIQPGDGSHFAAAVLAALERRSAGQGPRTFAEGFAWKRFGDAVAQALWPRGDR
ncbi:GDP-mannose-dependent alpha-(1-6)-phosphatidylinositol monomannoside mannosyltransferase [mine drainage metagenome]|uniref:GDP-mannose-dependent alpha-(1-6)-phosphatidylinositol monomannoside mannosyltransferase n=1 Tax=mine drainage metagenome TaxID=410659 RepID=A0A1J5QT14_9ZZZZ